ncbi:MAG: hypothetical protein EOO28_21060 [Comamonadaceae bacterium]|nr:MAG: hypothetical protein EOO28_21060 [Comamonadaceae bacterium]
MQQLPEGNPGYDSTDRQRLLNDARAALAAWTEALADSGLTPQACLAAVQRAGGKAAVAQVRQEAGVTARSIRDRVSRDVMHRPATAMPRTRKLLLRGGI